MSTKFFLYFFSKKDKILAIIIQNPKLLLIRLLEAIFPMVTQAMVEVI